MIIKRAAIVLILLPLLLLSLTIILVDYLFVAKTTSTPFLYNECLKVWGHRGYFKNQEQNSLKSFQEAFDLGAEGIELDIFYDVEMDKFVVSHDFPYNLKENKLLILDEVFSAFGAAKYYWLDFKNYKNLSEKSIRNSILRMESLNDTHEIRDKIIIESKNVNNLFQFMKAGFSTTHWIEFNENIGKWKYFKYSYELKIKYILGYFSAISIHYYGYTPKLKKTFSGLPFLLFTINHEPTVNKYVLDDAVKVILSDENLYDRKDNSCRPQ